MTLTIDEIRSRISTREGDIRSLRVRHLALFGSFARGDATEESDVDLLVEFEGEATFDGYFQLKELLEAILPYPIDLVTRKAIKPRIYEAMKREIVHVC
jgi:predicted nucleotidyltransferase